MPVSVKKKSSTLLDPRRCKYCRGTFVPERAQDKDSKFCCPNHRKAYWRYGGLPFDKMKEQLMREVRKMIRAEFAAMKDGPPATETEKQELRGAVRQCVLETLAQLATAPAPNPQPRA